jgi:HPt (histidine-containing phosphotransfer) domain-containing protein
MILPMKIYDLNYLKSLSPGNPKFMVEVIQLFLKQVPVFIEELNKHHSNSDWAGLQYNAHKIGSHFDCLGIQKEYRDIARKIEEYAKLKENSDLIPGLLIKLESSLQQANKELNEELGKNYNIV